MNIAESKRAPLVRAIPGHTCGNCGKPIPPSRSRNPKVEREFCDEACENAHNGKARTIGRQVLAMGLPPEQIFRAVDREAAAPVRKKRHELIDLGSMTPQERLGTLCAAAERYGVIK